MPPICSSLMDGRTNSFSPSILFSSRNLFILGDFNCHHSHWDSRGTFYIAALAVAPSLIFPLLPLLLPCIAHGRCYRTWVLTTYRFFYLSLSLRSFAPTNVLLPSIFRKIAAGMWKRKRWKRYFFCGSGSAKNPPLPLPHRREEWRKKRNWFCYLL